MSFLKKLLSPAISIASNFVPGGGLIRAGMSLFNGGGGSATAGSGGSGSMSGAAADERARAGRYDQQANDSRSQYVSELDEFDPRSYLRESAAAGFDEIGEGYGDLQAQHATSLNRRGLFNSDLGGGRNRRDLNARIARMIGGLSMQAGQMEQGRIDRYGGLYDGDANRADDSRGRYLDLVAGNRDADIQERNSRWGAITGLLSAGAQAAGSYYGARRS